MDSLTMNINQEEADKGQQLYTMQNRRKNYTYFKNRGLKKKNCFAGYCFAGISTVWGRIMLSTAVLGTMYVLCKSVVHWTPHKNPNITISYGGSYRLLSAGEEKQKDENICRVYSKEGENKGDFEHTSDYNSQPKRIETSLLRATAAEFVPKTRFNKNYKVNYEATDLPESLPVSDPTQHDNHYMSTSGTSTSASILDSSTNYNYEPSCMTHYSEETAEGQGGSDRSVSHSQGLLHGYAPFHTQGINNPYHLQYYPEIHNMQTVHPFSTQLPPRPELSTVPPVFPTNHPVSGYSSDAAFEEMPLSLAPFNYPGFMKEFPSDGSDLEDQGAVGGSAFPLMEANLSTYLSTQDKYIEEMFPGDFVQEPSLHADGVGGQKMVSGVEDYKHAQTKDILSLTPQKNLLPFFPNGNIDREALEQICRLINTTGVMMRMDEDIYKFFRRGKAMFLNDIRSHIRAILHRPGPNTDIVTLNFAFSIAVEWVEKNMTISFMFIELIMIQEKSETTAYKVLESIFNPDVQVSMASRLKTLARVIFSEKKLLRDTKVFLMTSIFEFRQDAATILSILHRCCRRLEREIYINPEAVIPEGFNFDNIAGWYHNQWFTEGMRFPHRHVMVSGSYEYHQYTEAVADELKNDMGILRFFRMRDGRKYGIIRKLKGERIDFKPLEAVLKVSDENINFACRMSTEYALTHYLLQKIHLDLTPGYSKRFRDHFWVKFHKIAGESNRRANLAITMLRQLQSLISADRGRIVMTPSAKALLEEFPHFSLSISPLTNENIELNFRECHLLGGALDNIEVLIHYLIEGYMFFTNYD